MLDQEAQLLISMVNHLYFKFPKCVMFSLMSEILYLLHPFLCLVYLTDLYLFFRFQFSQLFLQEALSDSSRLVGRLPYCFPLNLILGLASSSHCVPHGLYIFFWELRIVSGLHFPLLKWKIFQSYPSQIVFELLSRRLCVSRALAPTYAAIYFKLDPHNRVCHGGL